MKRLDITPPELFLVASTRGILGIGIGMLVANRLRRSQRRAIGLTLLAVGALSTLPLAARILPRLRDARPDGIQIASD